jgi:hypothetical protein
MRKGLACALSAVVAGMTMFAPGVAAAAPVGLPEGLKVSGMEVVRIEQSGQRVALTLEPAGTRAPLVTCYVGGSGPASANGTSVRFTIDVNCDAVVDQLIIEVAMAMHLAASGDFQVPGSYNRCELLATAELSCTSTSACYFASYYWGLGHLQAFLDQDHAVATVETQRVPIACAV